MAAKLILLCASALFVQMAFSQIIPCGSFVTGNNGLVLGNVGLGGIDLVGPGYNSIGLANSALLGGIGSGLGVVGPTYGAGLLGYPDLIGYPNLGGIGSSGPLPVSTISPIGPSGLAVASENEIAGTLLASGTLPFLSAVSFEGALPTAGSGVATCGCGNGAVGILSEGFPGTYPGPFPTTLPGYATIGTGIGGIYY